MIHPPEDEFINTVQIQHLPITRAQIQNSKFAQIVDILTLTHLEESVDPNEGVLIESVNYVRLVHVVHASSLGNTESSHWANLIMTKIAQGVHSIPKLMTCTDSTLSITRIYTTPFVFD